MNGRGKDKLVLQLMGEIGLAKYQHNELGEYIRPKSFINVGSSKGLLILGYVYLRQIEEPEDILRRSEIAKLFWQNFEEKSQNNNLRGVINKINKVFISEFGFAIFEKGANRKASSFIRLVENFQDYLVLDVIILEDAISQNKTELIAQFANKKFCATYPLDPENENLSFWLEDQRLKYQQLLKQNSQQKELLNTFADSQTSAGNLLRKLALDNPGEEIIELYLIRKHNTIYPKSLSFRRERDLEAILNYCREHFRNLQNQLESFRSKESSNVHLQSDDMFEIFLAVAILGDKAPIAENSPILNSFFYKSLDNYYELDQSQKETYHAILQELYYDGWLRLDDEKFLSIINQEFAADIVKKNNLIAVEMAKILLEQYFQIYPNAEQYQHSLNNILRVIPFSEIDQEFYPILAKNTELIVMRLKANDNYGKIVDDLAGFFENMRGARYDYQNLKNYEDLLWLYLLALERVSDYSEMLRLFKRYTKADTDNEIFDYLLNRAKNYKVLSLFLKYCYRIGKIGQLQEYLNVIDKDFTDEIAEDSWAESLIYNVKGSMAWEVFGRSNYFRARHHFQVFKNEINSLLSQSTQGDLASVVAELFGPEEVNEDWLELIVATAQTKSLGVMDRSSYREAAKHCDRLSEKWRNLASSQNAIAKLYEAIGYTGNEELKKQEDDFKKSLVKYERAAVLAALTIESMKAGRYWETSKKHYDDALEWFEMAMVGWTDLGEKHMQLGNLQNMASVFGDMRDFEKAQEYFDEALELCKQDSAMKLQELRVIFNSGYMYQNYIGDYPNYSESCINEAIGKYEQCEQLVSDLLLKSYEIPKEFMVQFYSNKGLLGLDILRKDGHCLDEPAKTDDELKSRHAVLKDFEIAFEYAQETGKEELILRTKIYVLLLKAIESRRTRLVTRKIGEFDKKGYQDSAMKAMFELFFPAVA